MASWWRLTAFGDSTSILPLAALLAIWLCARRESMRSGWLLTTAVLVDGGVVAASKVMYMAWGVHPPGLDFIGLSGHSAMAFLFWPALGGIAAGGVLAACVATSRLGLGVHSLSEVLLASLWGAVVAAGYLWLTRDIAI